MIKKFAKTFEEWIGLMNKTKDINPEACKQDWTTKKVVESVVNNEIKIRRAHYISGIGEFTKHEVWQQNQEICGDWINHAEDQLIIDIERQKAIVRQLNEIQLRHIRFIRLENAISDGMWRIEEFTDVNGRIWHIARFVKSKDLKFNPICENRKIKNRKIEEMI